VSKIMSLFSRIRAGARSEAGTSAQSPVEMSPAEFLRLRRPDAPVLDVRTPAEFGQAHLEGSTNLDMMEPDFLDGVARLGLDPEEPVYLYCRSGNRSGHAARLLRKHGYARAFNVGGLDELVREGAPTAS
jgi:phage shock protein E